MKTEQKTNNKKPITKVIVEGSAQGKALVSKDSISFFGGVSPETGKVIEKGHSLFGKSVKDTLLVFPQGKGSTVGSYILYRMKKQGTAPKAIIVEKAEPIIVVGCVIAGIPLLECKGINIKDNSFIKIKDGRIEQND